MCVKVYYVVCTADDSVQSSSNSSTSQDDGVTTPQLSVHSDTHHFSSGQLLVNLVAINMMLASQVSTEKEVFY